ncbi:hypothetical protein AAHB33_19165 [Paenarthrobacter sp. S56]|uniref:hypothetical protein n=1 Tax=Paenarthrobacter sp. S56 TaxID=3138179 RepID=UPI003219D51C
MRARLAMNGFLLGAGLVAIVLALAMGLLGMHVIAGGHASHSAQAPAAAPAAATSNPGSVHAGHPGNPALETTAKPSLAPCSCPGDCPSGIIIGASCTPSLASASLIASLPDSTNAVTISPTAAAPKVHPFRAHFPDTPSPGKLSISRT